MNEVDRREQAELSRCLLAGEVDYREAASIAGEAIRRIADRITEDRADPLLGAMAIHGWARAAGAWDEESELFPELRSWGAEFLQLGDALEERQDNSAERTALQALIRGYAKAFLTDTQPPAWELDRQGHLVPPAR
jgi:hypothetical protein